MLSQYQATIPPESSDARELRNLNRELLAIERRIAINCQDIAMLQNSNRMLENHIQTIYRTMDKIEDNIKFEKMAADLEEMLGPSSPPINIPRNKL